jgi:hypothetical protein
MSWSDDWSEPVVHPPRTLTALDVLQAVYRNERLALAVRMRAAIAALPFESPKLAVTAVGPMNEGFALQLERAIKRSGKVIEAQAIKAI